MCNKMNSHLISSSFTYAVHCLFSLLYCLQMTYILPKHAARFLNKVYTGCFTTLGLTAGGDFLVFVIKKVHINMCPILDGYGVIGVF